MKIKYTLLILASLLFLQGFSFNWDWAQKISTPTQPMGMFCDANSNLFVYGSSFPRDENQYSFYYPNALADTSGSFIQKYDPNGQMLFQKRWHGHSFFIQRMIYDGNSSFYFTGLFAGSFVVDGVPLSSRGKADGMVGKMDMNGNIQWISTLGSSMDERGQGMCFNANKTNLVITGTTTDSLFVNNAVVGNGQQSTFVVILNLMGNYIDHQLYDLFPARDDQYEGNYGKEIIYSAGFYYMLTDRQGAHWNGDSLTGPVDGRYVYKLDMNLDTVWTKYINGPACYYGWNCSDLVGSSAGDIYVNKWCSYHYGGQGHLLKLDPITGNFSYDEAQNDGQFYHLYADAMGLCTVGEEGADYAPGPNSHYGQTIVKSYSYANLKLDSIKMPEGYAPANAITADGLGSIYITGINYSDTLVIIGNDTLIGDTNVNGYPTTFYLAKINPNITTALPVVKSTAELKLYPNPTKGLVSVEVDEKYVGAKLCVYDLLGKCLLTKSLESTRAKLDLSDYMPGMYLVEMIQGEKKIIRKMMVD